MNEEQFWQLIERSRADAEGDVEGMSDTLAEALRPLGRSQVEQFQKLLVAQSFRTYTWKHGDAAELVCGYLGDDGYTDFRSWMIAQGRSVYEAFVAEPDSLAGIENVRDACESSGEFFGAAAGDVYEEMGGTVGDDYEAFPILEPARPPSGEKLPKSEIRTAFPKLNARFPA